MTSFFTFSMLALLCGGYCPVVLQSPSSYFLAIYTETGEIALGCIGRRKFQASVYLGTPKTFIICDGEE